MYNSYQALFCFCPDGYYYDRRMGPSASAYPPPPNETLPYKPPTSSAQTLQPRILIPTPVSSPKVETYRDQKLAQHDHPYLAPISGRYHYQDPPPRPSVYRRPAVQRYVDPHTMKAYDVVPADDYPEPSAPPQSLLPSHDYHMEQRPGEPV